jgi:hydroxymethylpyrimidine/phosphomethylpyrimidine kinase
MKIIPKALTIAGSDSGGGAGIQADLKTFAAFGVYGTSVIAAITAQNTVGVTRVLELPPDLVAAQIDAVIQDIGADALKTGMLANAGIIEAVAAKIQEYRLKNLVVDPVMVAKSGDLLLRREAIDTLRSRLLPLAAVVTPNLPEASELTAMAVRTAKETEEAARRIVGMGAKSVVVKGGHRRGPAIDLFYDGKKFRALKAARIRTAHTHGTG